MPLEILLMGLLVFGKIWNLVLKKNSLLSNIFIFENDQIVNKIIFPSGHTEDSKIRP